MDPVTIVLAVGAVMLLAVLFKPRKNKEVQTEQGHPPPMSRVSREEWEELRALEELAAERTAYTKRLERARAALAPPRGVLRGADDDDSEDEASMN